MKTVALIYCRVSSTRQRVEGHGLDAQEHRCREYARQKGYEVEKVFKDSFTGGGDFWKRPDMKAMLEYMDSKSHKEYVVIFDDLKRFARDINFHWKLRQELTARNAKVECLNFTFEDTPEGEFIESILAAQGQLERKQNRRQVIQKQKARFERGYWPFYPPPGYASIKDPVHGKLLKPVEPKATIIKEALEGFASGRFSEQVHVQGFLQEKKFYGKKPVYLEAVKRLLTRVIYAGYVEYQPWDVSRIKGHHEPLISLETHERIQERLLGRVANFVRKDINEDFPLRGFVLCGVCREPLTASWSKGRNKKFPYYRCKTVSCSRHNKSIKRDVIEEGFHSLLKHIKPTDGALKLTRAICLDVWNKKNSELSLRKRAVRASLEKLKEERATYVARIPKATSEDVVKAYENKISEISSEILLIEDELANSYTPRVGFETALDSVFNLLKNVYSKWENGDINNKRLVLKLVFVDKLVYDHEKGFETPVLCLPLRAFEVSSLSRSRLVDMVRKSWNHLEKWIRDSFEEVEGRAVVRIQGG